MIAHVAEASEAKGRVVLAIGSDRPSEHAIRAAIEVARAFNAAIESLFVEDTELLEMARYPFAREVSFTGRSTRTLSFDALERDLQLVSQAIRRRIEAMAKAAEVPVQCRTVRDATVAAVAGACAECGPWNVVVLAEPLGPGSGDLLAAILETVRDATGVVAVGARLARVTGPVVIVLEEPSHLPAMLHAADRLVTVTEGQIHVLPVGADEPTVEDIEAQARLLLAERPDVHVELPEIARGESAVVAETIRRLRGGFMLAQFGGLAIPPDRGISVLATTLECPVLVVR